MHVVQLFFLLPLGIPTKLGATSGDAHSTPPPQDPARHIPARFLAAILAPPIALKFDPSTL